MEIAFCSIFSIEKNTIGSVKKGRVVDGRAKLGAEASSTAKPSSFLRSSLTPPLLESPHDES